MAKQNTATATSSTSARVLAPLLALALFTLASPAASQTPPDAPLKASVVQAERIGNARAVTLRAEIEWSGGVTRPFTCTYEAARAMLTATDINFVTSSISEACTDDDGGATVAHGENLYADPASNFKGELDAAVNTFGATALEASERRIRGCEHRSTLCEPSELPEFTVTAEPPAAPDSMLVKIRVRWLGGVEATARCIYRFADAVLDTSGPQAQFDAPPIHFTTQCTGGELEVADTPKILDAFADDNDLDRKVRRTLRRKSRTPIAFILEDHERCLEVNPAWCTAPAPSLPISAEVVSDSPTPNFAIEQVSIGLSGNWSTGVTPRTAECKFTLDDGNFSFGGLANADCTNDDADTVEGFVAFYEQDPVFKEEVDKAVTDAGREIKQRARIRTGCESGMSLCKVVENPTVGVVMPTMLETETTPMEVTITFEFPPVPVGETVSGETTCTYMISEATRDADQFNYRELQLTDGRCTDPGIEGALVALEKFRMDTATRRLLRDLNAVLRDASQDFHAETTVSVRMDRPLETNDMPRTVTLVVAVEKSPAPSVNVRCTLPVEPARLSATTLTFAPLTQAACIDGDDDEIDAVREHYRDNINNFKTEADEKIQAEGARAFEQKLRIETGCSFNHDSCQVQTAAVATTVLPSGTREVVATLSYEFPGLSGTVTCGYPVDEATPTFTALDFDHLSIADYCPDDASLPGVAVLLERYRQAQSGFRDELNRALSDAAHELYQPPPPRSVTPDSSATLANRVATIGIEVIWPSGDVNRVICNFEVSADYLATDDRVFGQLTSDICTHPNQAAIAVVVTRYLDPARNLKRDVDQRVRLAIGNIDQKERIRAGCPNDNNSCRARNLRSHAATLNAYTLAILVNFNFPNLPIALNCEYKVLDAIWNNDAAHKLNFSALSLQEQCEWPQSRSYLREGGYIALGKSAGYEELLNSLNSKLSEAAVADEDHWQRENDCPNSDTLCLPEISLRYELNRSTRAVVLTAALTWPSGTTHSVECIFSVANARLSSGTLIFEDLSASICTGHSNATEHLVDLYEDPTSPFKGSVIVELTAAGQPLYASEARKRYCAASPGLCVPYEKAFGVGNNKLSGLGENYAEILTAKVGAAVEDGGPVPPGVGKIIHLDLALWADHLDANTHQVTPRWEVTVQEVSDAALTPTAAGGVLLSGSVSRDIRRSATYAVRDSRTNAVVFTLRARGGVEARTSSYSYVVASQPSGASFGSSATYDGVRYTYGASHDAYGGTDDRTIYANGVAAFTIPLPDGFNTRLTVTGLAVAGEQIYFREKVTRTIYDGSGCGYDPVTHQVYNCNPPPSRTEIDYQYKRISAMTENVEHQHTYKSNGSLEVRTNRE